MVPKIDTMENPIDPQLHAPAPAPMMDPKKPIPDLFKLFFIIRMRYMLKLATIPEIAEIAIIKTKSTNAYAGT